MNLPQRMAIGLAAAVTAAVVSIGSARLFVAAREGFGAGDIPNFVFWTSFFAVLAFVGATLFARKLRRWSALTASILWGLTGAALGFVFTLPNFAMLGPWFGAWSFPVLYCWALGGASAFLVAVAFARRQGPDPSRQARV